MKKQSVTQIISEIFPYENKYFLNSLSKKGIAKKKNKAESELLKDGVAIRGGHLNYYKLMNVLTSFGKLVHLYAYTKGMGLVDLFLPDSFDDYTKGLDRLLNRYQVKALTGEMYIETEDYCGTLDGVWSCILPGGKKRVNVLIDVKTWKYYKDFYGILNRISKKDGSLYTDEGSLQKVRLQTSMYKDGYDLTELSKKYPIDYIAVVRVTRQGSHMIFLDYDISEYIAWKNNPDFKSNGKTLSIATRQSIS